MTLTHDLLVGIPDTRIAMGVLVAWSQPTGLLDKTMGVP